MFSDQGLVVQPRQFIEHIQREGANACIGDIRFVKGILTNVTGGLILLRNTLCAPMSIIFPNGVTISACFNLLSPDKEVLQAGLLYLNNDFYSPLLHITTLRDLDKGPMEETVISI